MTELHVYVAAGSCDEARRIVAELAPRLPDVSIELRDLSDERRPGSVFAVPTYVLDGRVVYMGNPTEQELMQKLASAPPPPTNG